MHWFDKNSGQYDLAERWVGLDYKELFLDPVLAEITYVHEVTHAVMAMQTDFGQATNLFFRLQDEFTKLQSDEVNLILKLLFHSQDMVQEGFATFMEISWLRNKTSKQNALIWAQQNLPPDYRQYLEPVIFGFELSKRYREFFTAKVSWLAMETGIRKALMNQDLLADMNRFKDYLSNEENNPNARFIKICDTLRIKSWLVTKDVQTIAKESGIKFHEPATKTEVAEFLNYITAFTTNPQHFTEEHIGDTLKGVAAFTEASKNMIVANLNLRIAETVETLFNLDDFLSIAKNIEIVFVYPINKNLKDRSLLKLVSRRESEIAIGGFTKDDKKFLTISSIEKAATIINNDLKHATLFVKWGGYDFKRDHLIWSNTARSPNLVVYNNIEQLQNFLKEILLLNSEINFKHLHIGVSDKHPFQTLLIKIGNLQPLHVVNCFGNKGISEAIEFIGDKTKVLGEQELRAHKKHINNLMCLWMGMPWEIDWVEIMIGNKI